MMKQESNEIGSEENNRARACDTCQSKPCTVYCHADSAYLCTSCDAQVHSANRVASRHKRVPVCESCERAPAAFLCEADDASLCTVCDAEIHSANPLARRHQRVPILPITGNSYSFMATHRKSETTIPNPENNRRAVDQEQSEKGEKDAKDMVSWLLPNSYKNSGDHKSETTIPNPENRREVDQEEGEKGEEDTKEVASWLLPNTYKNSGNHNNSNQDKGLLSTDDYLDFADYNSNMDYKFTGQYNQHQHQQECNVPQTSYGGDRVVPLQFEESRCHQNHKEQNFQSYNTYGSSGSHCRVSYNGSTNHNADISSMETSVVPESTACDTAAPHPGTPKGTINQLPDPPTQMIIPMNREARVLRYKEKKKTRKFEKRIRYASRKAYAERRPRINGRFAKRTEIEAVEDQRFNTMLMYNTGYGIVPSF